MQHKEVTIFVSYSHKDAAWLEELRPHLKSVARKHQLQLTIWDDTKIQTGDKWRQQLEQALSSAQSAVLLVSKYFLASDFILDIELPQLLKAADKKEVRLYTLLLSPCRFDDLPELSKYQTMNPPSMTLEGLSKVEYENVFLELTRTIEKQVLDTSHRTIEITVDGAKGESEPQVSTAKLPIHGRRRFAQASLPEWQRVSVLGEPNGDLKFLAIDKGKRISDCVMIGQLRLIDKLLQGALATDSNTSISGHVLFQLLIPRSFEHMLFKKTGTVLVLDEISARYPWELLLTDEHHSKPEALIIRELPTTLFNPRDQSNSIGALVVGDPIVESQLFPRLPGAAMEAREVAALLEESGQLKVRKLIGSSALDVIEAWYLEPWQILHFAGHGVNDYVVEQTGGKNVEQSNTHSHKICGLILDSELLITAAEIRKMRTVPDLVFLNASHMGVISDVGGYAENGASLVTAFAELGCRAIIAPGWAIDDAAAVTFASTFYDALLAGETFGRSVASARRATFDAHPEVSTWAAYQCYGDPNYRLND